VIGVRPESVLLGPAGSGAAATVSRTIPRGHFTEIVVDLATRLENPVQLRSYVDDRSPVAGLSPGDQLGVRLHSVLGYDKTGRLL